MSALGLDLTLSVASIAIASMSVKIILILGGVHLKIAKGQLSSKAWDHFLWKIRFSKKNERKAFDFTK